MRKWKLGVIWFCLFFVTQVVLGRANPYFPLCTLPQLASQIAENAVQDELHRQNTRSCSCII